MCRVINAPGCGNDFIYRLNAADKRYLKGEMKLIDRLGSNDTTHVGMIRSASKGMSIKFSDKCIHILNNKEILN